MENRALHNQYEELKKSLEFHINKVEQFEKENKVLKQESSSLKQSLRITEEQADKSTRLPGAVHKKT